ARGQRDERPCDDVRAHNLRDTTDGEWIERKESRHLLRRVAMLGDADEPARIPLRERVEEAIAEPKPGMKRRNIRRHTNRGPDQRHRRCDPKRQPNTDEAPECWCALHARTLNAT